MEGSSFFNEEFFNKYGFVSCYECDEVFYNLDKLYEHQMIHFKEEHPHIICEMTGQIM